MAHANRKQIALYVTDEEHEKITKYAEKIGISRQKLLSNMINTSLDELDAMDRYKILGIGVGLRDLLYKIKFNMIDPEVVKGDKAEQS